MWSGQAAKYPDIRWIWSHAGGTAPFLAGRIDRGSRAKKEQMPQGAMAEIKRFYYNTAGAANPGAIASLLQLVKSDHIMFGTDFPLVAIDDTANGFRSHGFAPADLQAIARGNVNRPTGTLYGERQAYNVQTVVTEQQIILAAEISLHAPDFGHLERHCHLPGPGPDHKRRRFFRGK